MSRTKKTFIPELGITINELNTPKAAVSKHIALEIGLNCRPGSIHKSQTKDTVYVGIDRLSQPPLDYYRRPRLFKNIGKATVQNIKGEWKVTYVEMFQ